MSVALALKKQFMNQCYKCIEIWHGAWGQEVWIQFN